MSARVPSNLRQFLGQLQELIQYVQTVEEGRSGEALSRMEAEARAKAESERSEDLARQLALLQPKLSAVEEAKRQALSQVQHLSQQIESLRARLSQKEAEAGSAVLERDTLKTQLAEVSGLKLMAEKQFNEALASQQRQIQSSVARYSKEREELSQKLDQLRRELQDASRELHEVRVTRDRLLTETQREAQLREQLQKHIDDLEQKLHQAQAERSKASHLAKMSHAEAFEARDQAALLERRLKSLEQLMDV
jgi:chromosome segregation ATPase